MRRREVFHWEVRVGADPGELEDFHGVMDVCSKDGQTHLAGNLTSAELIVVLKVLYQRGIRLTGLVRRSLAGSFG